MIRPEFVLERCAGFRLWRQRSATAEAAVAALLPDPDKVLARGEIRKPGSRTHGGLVEVAGERYFLKRYNDRGWLYRLQHLTRRSRAVRTWWLAWAFLSRGVPVPTPLVSLEERRCRMLRRSYVLMEAVAGLGLREVWPQLEPGRKEYVLTALGRLLGRMHRNGCLHGDLKWDNILLAEGEFAPVLRLVDLDGGRLLWFPVRTLAQKDLDRCVQDLRRVGEDATGEHLLRLGWEEGWSGCGDGH